MGHMALNGTTSQSSDSKIPRKFLTALAEMVGRVATEFHLLAYVFNEEIPTSEERGPIPGPHKKVDVSTHRWTMNSRCEGRPTCSKWPPPT